MRYRFVDLIVDLDAGKSIHCQYTWPEDLDIFEDHFPAFPVVPGVLLTEMMGQSGALCIQSKYADHGVPMLIQINSARFRNWVEPGQLLDMYVEVLSVLPKLAKVKASTKFDGKSMSDVELTFTFLTHQQLGLPDEDPLLTEYHERLNENRNARR